jgi:hypothetical protein
MPLAGPRSNSPESASATSRDCVKGKAEGARREDSSCFVSVLGVCLVQTPGAHAKDGGISPLEKELSWHVAVVQAIMSRQAVLCKVLQQWQD